MITDREKFSSLFANDGQHWTSIDGRDFDQVMADMSATAEYAVRCGYDDDNYPVYESGYSSQHMSNDPVRYIFPDGTVIVAAGDAWDFEGETPFSWPDA